jgi:hypothetical protein
VTSSPSTIGPCVGSCTPPWLMQMTTLMGVYRGPEIPKPYREARQDAALGPMCFECASEGRLAPLPSVSLSRSPKEGPIRHVARVPDLSHRQAECYLNDAGPKEAEERGLGALFTSLPDPVKDSKRRGADDAADVHF